ncbi:MAG: DUF2231 domain-containing protein [Candidatus Limnocylindria bacterium]
MALTSPTREMSPYGGDDADANVVHPSTAAIGGHPLHPALVPLPIGLLTAAAASDVANLVTGDGFFARMSRWLIRGGLLTGVMAAALGLLDFSAIRAARGPVGIAHASGNTAVIGLSALSLVLRRSSDSRVPSLAMLLSAIAALLLAGTGWLGGELAYRKRIGVARR